MHFVYETWSKLNENLSSISFSKIVALLQSTSFDSTILELETKYSKKYSKTPYLNSQLSTPGRKAGTAVNLE